MDNILNKDSKVFDMISDLTKRVIEKRNAKVDNEKKERKHQGKDCERLASASNQLVPWSNYKYPCNHVYCSVLFLTVVCNTHLPPNCILQYLTGDR